MEIEGGCYCGAIRYRSTGAPEISLQCHCRECQYATGGNANVIVVVPADKFRFTKGVPKEFTRRDLDKPVTRLFCANCGTAIGNRSPFRKNTMILKVGTMDDPSWFKSELAIFTIDKQPFHHVADDLPQFDRRPG